MKKIPVYLLLFLPLLAFPQKEKQLFNGKNLKGWHVKIYHHEFDDNYANTFRVEEGMIKVRYDKYDSFNNRFAGIWREDAPIYTRLNSGLMFHAQDPKTILKEQDWPISVEMQFLAEEKEGVPRPTGNMCSPGTDVVFQGKKDPRHCIESSSKTYKKEEWIKAELIVRGDSLVQHIINGEIVLEYTKPTMGGGVANNYDVKLWQEGKPLKSGFIALQSEGQEIDFRNISIIDLSKKK